MSKESAPHYYPPNKRKEMADYLSGSSIWNAPDRKTDYASTNKVHMKAYKIDADQLAERKEVIERSRVDNVHLGRDNPYAKVE